MALNADAILKHTGALETKPVHVPAWRDDTGDDTVIVRGMTVREFEVNQATLGSKEGTATAALVARCVVDENGRRVFTDDQVNQIAELGFRQINKIGQAISELSGLNDDDEPDVAAAGKDSEPASGDKTSSD